MMRVNLEDLYYKALTELDRLDDRPDLSLDGTHRWIRERLLNNPFWLESNSKWKNFHNAMVCYRIAKEHGLRAAMRWKLSNE